MFLLGVLLLCIPVSGKQSKEGGGTENTETAEVSLPEAGRSMTETELQLSALLSSMEGAGRVQVMLSRETGDETILAEDRETGGSRTVVLSAGSGKQTVVVTGLRCGSYRGAVILAEGADSARVRLELAQAVSALTGLGTGSICVLKMNG